MFERLRHRATIENPAIGAQIAFRTAPRNVDPNDSLVFDYYLEPGGFAVGRMDHVHPNQEERFEVKSGRLTVRIDGDEWTATPGTRFAIPSGTPHTVWNQHTEPVHAVVEITPALSIARFLETMYGLAREGRTVKWGLPKPLQLAVIAWAFRDELYLAALPRWLQQAGAAGLAAVGRRAGYRATYPRFSEPKSDGATIVETGRKYLPVSRRR